MSVNPIFYLFTQLSVFPDLRLSFVFLRALLSLSPGFFRSPDGQITRFLPSPSSFIPCHPNLA
jgi:hypothetical protein